MVVNLNVNKINYCSILNIPNYNNKECEEKYISILNNKNFVYFNF